ncbi:formate/nitrite transporter family protein [Sphingomonas carotinifaciens]|uniref:formate/nitrite transporter family protein n=1 Tax=Sphingomonas carotinifaciens TaxID=1166323 RepID=UPI0023DD0FCF|nr:formate/nitrite transporter family protein [Sphingomonas carotinifaciens]
MNDPTGAKIAQAAPDALADKAELPWARMMVLAMLAGMFIGFGSIAFLIVQANAYPMTGPAQLLSGAAFSVGLILVMLTGAELFTGNTMFTLPAAMHRLTGRRLFAAWIVAWAGNLIGSVALAALFTAAGGLEGLEGHVGEAAARVAQDKLDKAPATIFASGVLANILVCLAVWMAMSAGSIPAKILAIIGPVTIFVAAGFEHSVANMSLIPMGLMAGTSGGAVSIGSNLVVSTIGNIVGGSLVSLALGFGHGQSLSGDDHEE